MSQTISAIDEEFNFQDIENQIINSLRKTLKPIISNYEKRTEKYKALSLAIKDLPEFQELITENAELKNRINQMQWLPKKHVGLEISEKDADDDSSDVVDVVGIENDMTRLKIAEKNGGIVNVSDSEDCPTHLFTGVSIKTENSTSNIKEELHSEIEKATREHNSESDNEEEDEHEGCEEVDAAVQTVYNEQEEGGEEEEEDEDEDEE